MVVGGLYRAGAGIPPGKRTNEGAGAGWAGMEGAGATVRDSGGGDDRTAGVGRLERLMTGALTEAGRVPGRPGAATGARVSGADARSLEVPDVPATPESAGTALRLPVIGRLGEGLATTGACLSIERPGMGAVDVRAGIGSDRRLAVAGRAG